MRIGHEHRVQHMVCLHAEDPAADIHAFFFPDRNGVHAAHTLDRFLCEILRRLKIAASKGGGVGDLFLVVPGEIEEIAAAVVRFQAGIMYHQGAVAQFLNGLLQRVISGDAAVVAAIPDA